MWTDGIVHNTGEWIHGGHGRKLAGESTRPKNPNDYFEAFKRYNIQSDLYHKMRSDFKKIAEMRKPSRFIWSKYNIMVQNASF